MDKLVEYGGFQTAAVSSIGKTQTVDYDGPGAAFHSGTGHPSEVIVACSWSTDVARVMGESIGREGAARGLTGWYAPGINTHRSPFGGRNVEYYAADPFLMGRMAAQVVGAATDRGVYAYFKHFAVNDQEKNRESGISFLTEQALREIYLKSFQMVFEEGKSIGVMGSYNRMGLMETAANYNLLTEVLRGEWGFKGSVLSDMTHSGNGSVDNDCYECVTNRVLAGCNAQLDSGGFSGHSQAKWDSTLKAPVYTNKAGEKVISYSYWYAVRQCSKEHLYMSANCTATNRVMVPVVGEEYKTVEARKDFSYNVEIEGAAEIKLNHRVDTPEGLTIEGGRITGKVALEGVYHLDFVGYDADGKAVGAFKLILTAATGDGGAAAKKGCFGDIAACSAIISLVAIAGAGLLLVSLRKKRRA